MKLYHATTEEYWKEIQKEGVLWGRKGWKNDYGHLMSRCTYLAIKKKDAKYGKGDGSGEWAEPEVLLEIDWCEGDFSGNQWQLRCYEPISLSKIKRINQI